MALILFLWSFVQSTLTAIAISFVKKSRINYILSAVFLTLGVNTLLQYLNRFTNLKHSMPEFMFLSDVLDFLLPGLIFWYISELFGNSLTKKKAWIFVPAALALITSITYIASFQPFTFSHFIGSAFHLTLLFGIVIWKGFIFVKIHKQLKLIKASANNKQKEDLLWPNILKMFIGLSLWVALLLLSYHTMVMPLSENPTQEIIRKMIEFNYIIFNSSIILVTMFFVMKYPKAFSGNTIEIKLEEKQEENSIYKYYVERLNHLIEVDQVHLETELNEKGLAEKLEIQSYLLSKLLNDHLGKSFSEYINEKRVQHAKSLIAEDTEKKMTNFAIAVDSGFRSESVFYVNFKKHAGMTPRQYRSQLKEKMAS
ncbi:helix-turn-helix domain-containing protein [Flammeovirga pacifica]|uniref:HTH araC/xylS-type domain-containing protein n=1 Tax=Flammeovirga pacifica TaxID=915059 RepID=A0A1S1YSB7_FLAPC|nr:helix-turn-helix domain-containing protein [Flammeovirga pacifica]OHX63910.1 hypothetical protein NH26_20070 [Flammeovirga pacifica]